jgi:phycobilisome rod-core linker protein
MSIPILNYPLSCQNQRVDGFEICPGDEQPKVYTTDNLPTASAMDEIIWASYRQVFSEHQIFKSTTEDCLESQLRFNQIKVRDLIKGLLLSDAFRKLNYDSNNNYRFCEMCVQRVLGRDIYSERENYAFSVIIATKGIEGFISFLLDSDEYMESFGDSTVPYQRRRIISQRSKGETPFNLKTPRTSQAFVNKAIMPQLNWSGSVRRFRPQEQTPRAGDPALFLSMVTDIV